MPAKSRGWGQCPSCNQERKLDQAGFLVAHNRWSPYAQAMMPCEGSSCWPARSDDEEPDDERQPWPPRVHA